MKTFFATPSSSLLTLIAISILGLLFAAIFLYWHVRQQFGAVPTAERLRRVESSPQFDRKTGTFQNQDPREIKIDVPLLTMLRVYFLGPQIRTPTQPLPSLRPNLTEFLKPPTSGTAARLIWLGHSCVLLNIAGKIILLDPTLTQRVAPVFFAGARFQQSPLRLEELPPIDYIIISHDHYDHLDAGSIRFFAERADGKSRFITTLGVGARLETFGVDPNLIVELDWWESFEDQGLRFTATASQHFSGRGFGDRGKTLWAGFTIRHPTVNLFFSGDSGYFSHFKEIGSRLGPFDFAVLESGQYNIWWRYVHMLPEEVVQAAQDIRTKAFMPIHWGMYNLSIHDWFEPIDEVHRLAHEKNVAIRTPILGETVAFASDPTIGVIKTEEWWKSHPDYVSRK